MASPSFLHAQRTGRKRLLKAMSLSTSHRAIGESLSSPKATLSYLPGSPQAWQLIGSQGPDQSAQ